MGIRKESRKTTRIRLGEPLRVVLCSIGAEMRYELTTRNVSNTGFFLDFEKPGRFPFTPASIMEVWIELEPDLTIFLNGKMARVVYADDPLALDTGPGIGIRIVQIDSKNERLFLDFIERKYRESQQPQAGLAG